MPVERLCEMRTKRGAAFVEVEYSASNSRISRMTVVCEMPVKVTVRSHFDEAAVFEGTVQAGSTDLPIPTGGRSLTRDFGASYKTYSIDRTVRLGPYIHMEA